MAVDVALDTRMDTMRRLVPVDAEATPRLRTTATLIGRLASPRLTPSHTLRESNPEAEKTPDRLRRPTVHQALDIVCKL